MGIKTKIDTEFQYIFAYTDSISLDKHVMLPTSNSKPSVYNDFLKKNYISVLILLFWVVVVIIVFVQSTLAMQINNETNDWFTTLVVSCSWLLWSLLTPVIVRVVNKIDTRNIKLYKEIIVYLGLSIVFVAVHIVLEMTLYNLTLIKEGVSFKLPVYIIYHTHTQFLAFFFIVFVVKGIAFYERYIDARLQEEKLNTELSNARLQVLKMQLNPHFLFNTHHSIISLMLKSENDKAISMLVKLSDFLRITLENKDQLNTLSNEIQIIKLYLDIQQIRFGDKLTINIDLPRSIEEVHVPAFILQPIVENSIIHGIAPFSSSASLKILCKEYNDSIEIEVFDSGPGLKTREKPGGIGLANTKNRLAELYGTSAGIEIKPHLIKGTVVKIWLPIS